MTDPSLALQTALRAALTASAALAALVPAANILDRTGPAQRFPAVLIGEGQTIHEEMTWARDTIRVYLDLHLWDERADLTTIKVQAGAVRDVLRLAQLTPEDYAVVDLVIQATRFMRDHEGQTPLAHGVLTVNALLQELPS